MASLDEERADRLAEEGKTEEAIAIYKRLQLESASSDKAQAIIDKMRELKAKPEEEEPVSDEAQTAENKEFEFKDYGIKFEHVIGLKRQKLLLQKMIGTPLRRFEAYKAMKMRPGTGVLLYGAPGVGKTLLVEGLSGELGIKMADIELGEVLDRLVGEGEKKIKALFTQAKRIAPAIIFLDEVDAIAMDREKTGDSGGAGEMRTIMTALLKQLGSALADKDNRIFVLGATNQPWNVDVAMKRPGRLEFMLYVRPPTLGERERMFRMHLESAGSADYFRLALATIDYSPADIEAICRVAKVNIIEEEERTKVRRRLRTSDVLKVLRMPDYGRSRLDDWYAMMQSTYIGNQRKVKARERGVWVMKEVGQAGKFTKADMDTYKDLVKDVRRHMRHLGHIRLQRWIYRR